MMREFDMEDLSIPSFLLRKKEKPKEETKIEVKVPTKKKRALTTLYKEKLAQDVINYVSKGHNTFGKLRKCLSIHPTFGNVEDREIKSAIRFAMSNRIPSSRVIGKGKTRHLSISYRMLSIKSKTYEIIDL